MNVSANDASADGSDDGFLEAVLFVVSGPSGSGKGTAIDIVKRRFPEASHVKTFATRSPRPGENQTGSYVFVSDAAFERLVEQGEIAESVRTYDRGSYGSPTSLLRASGPAFIIVELDPVGMLRMRRQSRRRVVSVFVLPSNENETRRRILERGHVDDLDMRMDVAKKQIQMAWAFDYVLVNDSLAKFEQDLETVVRAEMLRASSVNVIRRAELTTPHTP